MASINACAATSSIAHAGLGHKRHAAVSASPVLGLPSIMSKKGAVKCSMESPKPSPIQSATAKASSLIAAVSVAAVSSPAMALVDDRMSTEGTGLPFGLSNNLLGWILFGVFGLIWALYFIYASSLEEDEESGLSL